MAAALIRAPVGEPVSRSVGELNRVKSPRLKAEGSFELGATVPAVFLVSTFAVAQAREASSPTDVSPSAREHDARC